MAYDFHRSSMMPLTFTFKEKAKLPHRPQGALQREEQARSAVKRARLAADSSKLQLRASGRARLRQVLLGRAAEDAVLDSEECRQVAMIRDRLKACEVADDALLQLQHLAAMPVDAAVLRQTGVGRVVNDAAKAWKGQEAAGQTLAAARELVAKWRAMHRQETGAVDDVSADLEKALWEDLATEDDIDDSDEEYQARLEALVHALGSADVRQRAMTRSQARTVVEEALSAMSSAERRLQKTALWMKRRRAVGIPIDLPSGAPWVLASPTSIKKFSWSPQLCESDDFHQPRISRSGSSGALSVATSIASAQTLPCRQISGTQTSQNLDDLSAP
ncbi:unnamed protein product [Symbiodinium sp. CCMP2592]|nr:unnamed protein product [Symbiodinium sp. CCMP2592]